MLRGRNFSGAAFLSVGTVAGGLASFARNIIVARLISVEDFGIAASFAATVAFIELASDLAIDRLLIQARDGNKARLQASAQAFQVIRGIIGTALLYLIAAPIAGLFKIPDVVWAFELLALVPLIRCFSHLDYARLQREMKFGPHILVKMGPQILTLAIAVPLGGYFSDYRLMLWLILIQNISMTLFSHLAAKRKYVWAWDRVLVKRMVSFGWPLLANGFLMFGIFQGDRVIVGAFFGMADLGWFATAFTITLVPSLMFGQVFLSYFLPQLSQVQADRELFDRRSVVVTQICLLAGVVFAVGFVISGPALIVLLYGDAYRAGASVVGLLGLMQAVRLSRVGPTIVSIAQGQTRNPLYANIARMAGLALALVSVMAGLGISSVVICALVGEIIASLVAFLLARREVNTLFQYLGRGFFAALIFSLVAFVLAGYVSTTETPVIEVMGGGVIAILAVVLCLAVMPEAKKWLFGANDEVN